MGLRYLRYWNLIKYENVCKILCTVKRPPNLILYQVLIFTMIAISVSAVDLQNGQKLKFLPPKLQMLKSSNMHTKAAVKF